MEHPTGTVAATAHAHPDNSKVIWRTLGILTLITLVELAVGMFIAPHYHHLKIWFGILYLICTLAKAAYIVAEFMHLRHEVKNMIMTIVFPLLIFVWFIIAFLWDGDSYKQLRDTYNKQLPKLPAKETPHQPAKPGGEAHDNGVHH
jgi:cytochrome c oxidase subunit IV